MDEQTVEWKQEFVRLLLSGEENDWKAAFALKAKHLPPKLYRYRPPNENALTELEDEHIWLAAASLFNDPFDSALSFDVTNEFGESLRSRFADDSPPLGSEITNEHRARIADAPDPLLVLGDFLVEEQGDGIPPDKLEVARTFYRDFAQRQADEMADVTQAATKIAAFSERSDSLLMWSHYADSHRGVCLEYDVSQLADDCLQKRLMLPVNYSKRHFALPLSHPPRTPNYALVAATHKAVDWEYEREWRLVYSEGTNSKGVRALMPRPLAVILGARVSDNYRAKVGAVAKAKGIPVRTVVLSRESYELMVVESSEPEVAATE